MLARQVIQVKTDLRVPEAMQVMQETPVKLLVLEAVVAEVAEELAVMGPQVHQEYKGNKVKQG